MVIWPPQNPIITKEGKRLSIDCSTEDHSSTMKWYKRTKGVDRELNSSLIINKDKVVHSIHHGIKTVRFMNVGKNDSGIYVCKKHGSLSGEKFLQKRFVLVVLGEF